MSPRTIVIGDLHGCHDEALEKGPERGTFGHTVFDQPLVRLLLSTRRS